MRASLGALVLLVTLVAACGGGGGDDTGTGGADLDGLATTRIAVGDAAVEVWIADTAATRQRGLMFATAEQLAPLADGTPRGMLFVFPDERTRGFYMRDTIVALDLAYARADGTIVELHDLLPLDETVVFSGEPIGLALEVPAGTLAAEGVDVGDRIVVPRAAADS